jgi:serine-type D-Ala-D-Ala endopeptidase (penicillin-binding protein 7)
MFKRIVTAVTLAFCLASPSHALSLNAKHAMVMDEKTGEILFEKNADAAVPIASLTKLLTAMVVLDAHQDMDEEIVIDWQDVDTLKHSTSRVPVGATLSKKNVLELALMSSDNRAAAALARTYPGTNPAFMMAMRRKIRALGLTNTSIDEPTGLSPGNVSSASDLAKVAMAAAKYPEIVRITTSQEESIEMKGREVNYRNTNRFVGKSGWPILLSKTGYINEAGRCIVMTLKHFEGVNPKNVIMVLLNAGSSAARASDMVKVRNYVAGDGGVALQDDAPVVRKKSPKRQMIFSAKAGSKNPAKTARATKKTKSVAKVVRKKVRNGSKRA